MQKQKITTWQTTFLIISMILPTAILSVPTAVVGYARSDAWISLILATVAGVFVAYICGTIAIKHPGLSIFQIMDKIVGRIISKVIGFMLFYYFFVGGFGILWQFHNFMVDSVMKHTPPIVFSVVAVLLVLYALFYGIEVIARVNQIILMSSFLAFALSTLFYFKEMKFDKLLPVLETPFNRILMGTFMPFSWLSEVAAILILATFLNDPGQARKSSVLGVLLTGLSMIWMIIGSLAIFGEKMLALFEYPTFNVFRIIEVAGFLERIDAVFIAIWVGTMMMKITIFMFCGFYSFCQLFGVREPIPFLFPYGMSTIALSIVSWNNAAEVALYNTYTSTTRLLFINIIIPIFLLLAALWQNRKKRVST